jgi:hypothetical protein
VITVGTTLNFWAYQPGDVHSVEFVTVAMHADDAFALATILMNDQSNISDDWKHTIRKLAQELVDAGNKCR